MLQLIAKKYLYFCLVLIFFLLTTFNFYNFNFNFFFKVEKVQFNKNKFLDEETKSKLTELILNKNFFFLEKNKLTKILYQNNWVKKVEIRKKLPNIIFINITEYMPIAYYESNKNIYIIHDGFESSSIVYNTDISDLIRLENVKDFKKLKIFYDIVTSQFNFFKEIKELHNIYDNRWNIILKNNKIIKLGNYDLNKQIKIANLFLTKENIRVLDLRINDRLVVTYDK